MFDGCNRFGCGGFDGLYCRFVGDGVKIDSHAKNGSCVGYGDLTVSVDIRRRSDFIVLRLVKADGEAENLAGIRNADRLFVPVGIAEFD